MGGQQREAAQGRREEAAGEVARLRWWRRAFLATLTASYGLGLLCAFVLVPATDVPWIQNGIHAPGAGPILLGHAWRWASGARDVLPWLAIPLICWGFAGHLGALDRWIKPLTGIQVLLLLGVLLLGGVAGAGYGMTRASGVIPLGPFPD